MRKEARDRPRDLLVAGHVNVDRFLKLSNFPGADRTAPIRQEPPRLGGTAANVARVAASLGVRTGLLARIGSGFPAEFRATLKRERIDLRGVETVPGVATPTCFILEDAGGGQRTLIDQGPNADPGRPPAETGWLERYTWLHAGTGHPLERLRWVAQARSRGLKVAADPAQEIFYRWSSAPFRRLLASSEILFGNRAEIARAARLTGARTVQGLLERVPLVVRTEGPLGATAFGRAGTVHVPAVKLRSARSLVGAGDAFRGGFYAGWFRGRRIDGCLSYGVRAAARWIGRRS